jgi:uncharacterized protein (DUF1697 family)
MNCSMPALRRAFERAGFGDVKTVLASGNVVFTTSKASDASLERGVEAAIERGLGKAFPAMVRSIEALEQLLAADRFRPYRVPAEAKRVVTFLRAAPVAPPRLPIELFGARILAVHGKEAYTTYLRTPKGPVFMSLIERTFGKDQTTRTLETVERLARVARAP